MHWYTGLTIKLPILEERGERRVMGCAGGSGLGVPGELRVRCLPSPHPGAAGLGA